MSLLSPSLSLSPGKTLQTLGLILANPPAGISYPRKGLFFSGRHKNVPTTTLIVSPLTVIGNWYQQIFNHVNGKVDNKNITIAKYHGPARENMLVRVQQGQLDVLMTSYHTLASDYKTWVEVMEGDAEQDLGARSKKKRRKAPHIFELEFHRIVLDEAHIVRNSQACLWKAVMSLQSERKVCLTGTPFVYVRY
jgi:SNF2 family DNA or RNA helicase